ncbi:MAG: hypothetical protein R3248_03275 [Candidatus Promineifilaceae bacterium]|nr:hypothetical protein [Candidatus Promineifilaceae bacterium]
MDLLKRLFGLGDNKGHHDPQGIYLYVECDRCGAQVRVRADKKYDLNRTEEGYTWHKTIVDSKCFQQIPTVVHFDRDYNVVESEIEGGHYITKEAYEAPAEPEPAPEEAEESETEPTQE